MDKQKSKNRKYKPGQLITINNKVYRVTKVSIFSICGECNFIETDPKQCGKFCFDICGKMPGDCYFKKI